MDGRQPSGTNCEIPAVSALGLKVLAPEEALSLMVETALYTGLRISESSGLTWGSVDTQARVITIRQRKSRRGAPSQGAARHG
jgi:integrase